MEQNVSPVNQPTRGQWTNKTEYLLSSLGYAVGLGNLWRFPFLCYRNGGGAFLIPYIIMLAVCGLPVFFLETALGQYHGRGANIVFRNIAPVSQGIGFAMVLVSFLTGLYYNVIMAWTFFYLYASFSSELGWSTCGNAWNSASCYSVTQRRECEEMNLIYWNNTCWEVKDLCHSINNVTYLNRTHCLGEYGVAYPLYFPTPRISPSEDYFLNYMLAASSGFEDFGELRWQLTLCLCLSWALVAVCLIKGIKSSGKVVYFTTLFPFVVLVILLIRGVTLEGALDGIYFYIVPKWDKLKQAQAWGDAAVQIFYSLGLGFGGLLTLASYSKFNNNCYRDSLLICIMNSSTSIFAGFVIFSVLGFMAQQLGVPVDKVVNSGPGLAFIAYPEAITMMPFPQIWAILFFFMLITLAVDTQFTLCETVITAARDEWPTLRNYTSPLVIIVCSISFLLGLPFCYQGGIYLFTLVDAFAANWAVIIICICELILVSWCYGLDNFVKNIQAMIGHVPNCYWTLSWKYFCPTVLLGIFTFSLVNYTQLSFGNYVFPLWATALGWLITCSSLSMIIIFSTVNLCNMIVRKKSGLREAFRPTEKWAPSEDTVNANEEFQLNNHYACVYNSTVVESK